MSMTPDERMETEKALNILRIALYNEREKRREWQAWALILEQQMRREGWTQADLDEVQPSMHH